MAESKRGRPFLPAHERRTELQCVRLNQKERRRLERLSGLLDLVQLAAVFREGLVALEERQNLSELQRELQAAATTAHQQAAPGPAGDYQRGLAEGCRRAAERLGAVVLPLRQAR